MRTRDVELGHTYAAKVSERVVPVTVLRDDPRFGGWWVRNERSGREVRVKSAQRFRFELSYDGERWVRVPS